MKSLRSPAAAIAVLALLLVPAAAAHHYLLIQPGAPMTAPNGCTMNFVFKDQSGKTYIGTASHCVSKEGQTVRVSGTDIGTVKWKGSGVDIALVEVKAALLGQVRPAMRYWGGPTGVAPAGTGVGVVYHYGFGLGYGESELSRARAGLVTSVDSDSYLAETSAVFGDSGAPVMLANGQALGVISEFALEQGHTDRGPTIAFAIQRAQVEKGLTLTLQTAPLAAALDRDQARVGHTPVGN